MLVNDIRDIFNQNLNIQLTPTITIDKIYREHDRKPSNNFVYFKEDSGVIDSSCNTNEITIEIVSVFENELLSMRCRDEIVKLIKNNSVFSSLIGNHSNLYSNGIIEYEKTLFVAPLTVTLYLI